MVRSPSCVLLLLCGLWSSVYPDDPEIRYVGDNITLVAKYKGVPSEISWKVDGNKVVEMELIPKLKPHFYRLGDRANISDTDGSLTIRNLTVGDSGEYKAEAMVENNIIEDTFISLIVRENVSSGSVTNVTETSTVAHFSIRSSTNHTDIQETSTVAFFSIRSTTKRTSIQKTTPTKSPTKSLSTSRTTLPAIVPPAEPENREGPKPSSVTGFIVFAVVLTVAFIAGAYWWFCIRGKKGKWERNGETANGALLEKVVEDTKAGNHVTSEEVKVTLDTTGPEETNDGDHVAALDTPGPEDTKAINHVNADEENATLTTPEPETKSGNDVQPEEETALLDTSGKEETKPDDNVKQEEEKSSSNAPEPEAGNNEQPKNEISNSEMQGTEAGNNEQPKDEISNSEIQGTAL